MGLFLVSPDVLSFFHACVYRLLDGLMVCCVCRARFGVTDLLRRKYGDGVLPARMEQRLQPLRQLLATELYGCKAISLAALPPPIPPDVLVGRALQTGTAESSFAEPPTAPSMPTSTCRDVAFAASLAGEAVVPTDWSVSGTGPDPPVAAERAVVWLRSWSPGLSATVHQQFRALCGGEHAPSSSSRGVLAAGADLAVLHPCHRPDFVAVELVEAASLFHGPVAGDPGLCCELLDQALPLRRLIGREPAFPLGPGMAAVEAAFGPVQPRSMLAAGGQVCAHVSRLAQRTSLAFWETDAVAQAKKLLVTASGGAAGCVRGANGKRKVEPSILCAEHQPVPSTLLTIDCPVLTSFLTVPNVTVSVSKCTSLPCSRAAAQAALRPLDAGGPATNGMWARRLFEDTSALPWRWHWDQTIVVIGAPPAWTLDEAADRTLEASVYNGAKGLTVTRALPDLRRHVESLWRACAAPTARYQRGEEAALLHSFSQMLLVPQLNGHARDACRAWEDPARALENSMCSYDTLQQPANVVAGPVEARRSGRPRQRGLGAVRQGGSSAPPDATGAVAVRHSASVLASSIGAGALGDASGELASAELRPEHARPALFASSTPSVSPTRPLLSVDEPLVPAGERRVPAAERRVPVAQRPMCGGERLVPAAERLVPAGEVAFSEADSSTLVPTDGSGSRARVKPASGSSSGERDGSRLADVPYQVAALDRILPRKPRPLRVLRNPQQLNVTKTQLDSAAQLLGRSTVLVLPPPMQPLSLTCLLAETYLVTTGFDHRCLWLSSASTASLTNAFEFHQLALPDHHLVLLDAEPRASAKAAAAAARFVFASVSAARAMLVDHALFSFVVFDCGASDFQAKELADLVALQPQLRLVPSTALLVVEDAVNPLGVAVRDVQRVAALVNTAQCGVTSALVRRSTDVDVQGVIRSSVNDYVEPSMPVTATLRLLDAAAGPLIRPLWLRRHPVVCASGDQPVRDGLSLPPAQDSAPRLRDLVTDNLSGAVVQMQEEFVAAAGPVQTTLMGRGSLSDLKVLTTLHVLRCARDHALLHGVDTCLQFLQEAQAHYEGQVQSLSPWCQRIEEEMWDAGAGQPSVTAVLQQIVASESGSILIVTGPRDLGTISAAFPNVRRLNEVGLAESASPRLSSSESSSTADVLVADHDDLAAVSDAIYPRLALVVLVSTTPPVALLQFINAGAVRCRCVRMSEAAAAAQLEEERVASRFDVALQRCSDSFSASAGAPPGLVPLASLCGTPTPSVIRLPSRFCENHSPPQLAAVLASQLPPPPCAGLVVTLEVGPAFLVSFSTAVSHLTASIVSSSRLCSRVSLTVTFPAGADLSTPTKLTGPPLPGFRRGPGGGSSGSSSSGRSRLAGVPLGGRGRGRGRGGGSSRPLHGRHSASAPPKRRYSVGGSAFPDSHQMRLLVTRRV